MIGHAPVAMKLIRDKMVRLIQKGWCQGYSAEDQDGRPLMAEDPRACRWCLTGALGLAVFEAVADSRRGAVYDRFLQQWATANRAHLYSLRSGQPGHIEEAMIEFNDQDCMTQDEVVSSLLRMGG